MARSKPLSPDEIVAALKKWKIQYVEYRDWRTHTREGAGRPWGPVTFFGVHNFGSDISDENSMSYLYNGDLKRGLPGPLAPFGIDDLGIVYLLGSGRSNHAGPSDVDTVALARASKMPMDRDVRPDASMTSGVTTVVADEAYGTEMAYGKAPTAKTRATMVQLAAAIFDAMGWEAGRLAGHRELTTTRSDPVGIKMFELRRDLAAALKAGPPAGSGALVATPQEMNQIADLTVSKLLSHVVQTKTPPLKATLEGWITQANIKAQASRDVSMQNAKQLAQLAGRMAGLESALGQIAAGVTSIDMNAVREAAEQGANAAFDDRVAKAVAEAQVELQVTPADPGV